MSSAAADTFPSQLTSAIKREREEKEQQISDGVSCGRMLCGCCRDRFVTLLCAPLTFAASRRLSPLFLCHRLGYDELILHALVRVESAMLVLPISICAHQPAADQCQYQYKRTRIGVALHYEPLLLSPFSCQLEVCSTTMVVT